MVEQIALMEQSFLKLKGSGWNFDSNTLRYFSAITKRVIRVSNSCMLHLLGWMLPPSLPPGSSHTFTQLSCILWISAKLFLRCIFPTFISAHRFSWGREERSSLGTLRVITLRTIRHEHKCGCKELCGRLLPNWKSKFYRDTAHSVISYQTVWHSHLCESQGLILKAFSLIT